ncbi:carboxypeptidase-like regulatory domain-containing protein [Parabacteroides sp. Marseille-P3160]|uniref:carboxypeptidase-like regulatory domain-containing protein n=1 Tax=Parabacteroides sp. Marseille-P3160 TaxID=1917887 RepID=UPI0009BA07E0|nr:carboxypeptidase-like regulatory domain-containing protein [Parabacteroides sp. Marseille-P3160]
MKKNKIILLKWNQGESRYLIPFFCVFLLLYSTIAFAQTTIVQGKVVDTPGEILMGVSVKLKGTSIGMITNAAGEFSLNIPERNATLEFSYIDLKKYEL